MVVDCRWKVWVGMYSMLTILVMPTLFTTSLTSTIYLSRGTSWHQNETSVNRSFDTTVHYIR